jgi:hypothetical protein
VKGNPGEKDKVTRHVLGNFNTEENIFSHLII